LRRSLLLSQVLPVVQCSLGLLRSRS
jgi:hypothetical protein